MLNNIPKYVELENYHKATHIGVFFGLNADYSIRGTWVASNYYIEEDERNRKLAS